METIEAPLLLFGAGLPSLINCVSLFYPSQCLKSQRTNPSSLYFFFFLFFNLPILLLSGKHSIILSAQRSTLTAKYRPVDVSLGTAVNTLLCKLKRADRGRRIAICNSNTLMSLTYLLSNSHTHVCEWLDVVATVKWSKVEFAPTLASALPFLLTHDYCCT